MHWGSRLILPKGREQLKAIELMNLAVLSIREPNYWPSDKKKTLDLLDVGIIMDIPKDYCLAESYLGIHRLFCNFYSK